MYEGKLGVSYKILRNLFKMIVDKYWRPSKNFNEFGAAIVI